MVNEISIGAAEFERLGVTEVREVSAFLADLFERQNRAVLVDERRLARGAGRGKCERVDVVAFLKGDGLQVGRYRGFVGVGKHEMYAAVGAVEFDRNKIDGDRAACFGLLVAGIFGIVDAAVGAKGGRNDLIALQKSGGTRRSNDKSCFAAGYGHADQVVPRVGDPRLSSKEGAGTARNEDGRAIRAPRRMNIFAGLVGELLRRGAVSGDFPKRTAEFFVPGCEYERLSIRRPRGRVFGCCEGRSCQTARLAVGQILNP